MLTGTSCQRVPQTASQHDTQPANNSYNSIYYWKTTFALNATEKSFLEEYHIRRLYLRLFDVIPAEKNDPLNQSFGFEAIPNATIAFLETIPQNIEVVPVVYITIDALRLMQNSDNDYAGLLTERVMNMADFHDLGPIHEVQLDCDWTRQTQDSFFALCQQFKEKLKPYSIELSCTIRLWQLRSACPPVDRGVLMLYNTGDLTKESTSNAILDLDDIQVFLKGKDYNLPMSLAYPVFSWNVWFRNGQYLGLFHGLDLNDTSLYQAAESPWYIIQRDHKAEQRELLKGDRLRHEQISFSELQQLDSLVRQKHPSFNDAPVILYHLDSANLSHYSPDEIRQIYNRH